MTPAADVSNGTGNVLSSGLATSGAVSPGSHLATEAVDNTRQPQTVREPRLFVMRTTQEQRAADREPRARIDFETSQVYCLRRTTRP